MTAIRIQALAALDPQAVPLPHGTEVITGADRIVGTGEAKRVVPRGAVSRVVRREGDELVVQVVGVGEVRYARRELSPRRAGQLRFAARRAAAEVALLPCAVLEAVVGSRAWGLADEGSDTDRRGVFRLPFPWTTGLAPPITTVVSPDGSATYWEYE